MFSIIFVIRVLFYINLVPYFLTPDSIEYKGINVMKDILAGKLNARRVPLYPLLLNIISSIFPEQMYGENFGFKIIVLIQMILSCLSVVIFFRILCMILKNKNLIILSTVIYACMPSVIGFDKTILTESISLSCTVFLLYYVVKYLKEPSVNSARWVVVITGGLVFFRPSFLAYFIIISVFFGLRYFLYKEEKKIIVSVIKIFCMFWLCICAYSIRINQLYGVKSLSVTLLQQESITTVTQGFWKNSTEETNLQIKEYINDKLNENPDCNLIDLGAEILNFGLEKMPGFIKDCKLHGKLNYIKYYIKLLMDVSSSKLSSNEYYGMTEATRNNLIIDHNNSYLQGKDGYISKLFIYTYCEVWPTARFFDIYVVSIWELYVIINGFRKKKIEWLHLGIFGAIVSMLLCGIMGTYAEWGRTVITILPFYALGAAMLVDVYLGMDRSEYK